MAKPWKASPPDPRSPATIHEICRRYYACAATLAKVMGLPLSETFIKEYHQAISTCFIEASKCEVRLPSGVTLAPLVAPPNGQGETPVPVAQTTTEAPEEMPIISANNGHEAPGSGEPPLPTTVPAGLPCSGQRVTDLKPAQLRMLLSKVDQLAAEQGSHWRPLLEVLAAERQARIAKGRQRPAEAPGGGA